ncbi:SpoIIIAH-like family protein [Paenibacillus massiliensis]|uniref:SpoIIIAH-like family protein n=1 Tax=Paenibacillus massiliensis TaxID=225917 RepID=UPI00046F945F|nr:SpoIIIAH-like family protein [Paenibacillus massiliensis]
MNNKRQTIWLVSMLSLMVVLSAYYLFTESPAPDNPPVADSEQVTDLNASAAQETTTGDSSTPDGLVINEVVTDEITSTNQEDGTTGAEVQGAGESPSTAGTQDPTAPDKTTITDKETTPQSTATTEQPQATAKTDDQVLKEVAADQNAKPTAAAVIDDYLLERDVSNQKKHEELTAAMNDKASEDAAAAQRELQALEDKQAKITGIEEELQQQYASAVVREEDNDKYKVVVLSDKMDAKQAVGIVDRVMKELNVTQDKISVQYVAE